MPTDDERREIEKRLRDLKQLGRYSTACLVCEALSIDDMCPKDCDPERRLLDVAHAISDIIDPEPERTCSIELDPDDPDIEKPWYRCRSCGYARSIDDWSLWLYCPNCGARVVSYGME